ncbi:hydroxymethylpyrimidine/phosphomethylpyrimidine kinase [Halobacillus andaensis]|uniref:Hydroxymethylpyrimidine/phosphomethylpyrimidine kinase n=1 Tax=Halobacillus andaensis TaxID=1176239 RepID=A0A917EW53_HALAA|nr:bifunctional hydroxymethylpyrimidine kinase/phosphomethylpyrimidine kinase [Halobacillus andaensis]MBP2004577.1 pyridoxine kinase/hydroxymethylpyrimidine/phosphomethylpyrimidine kinase [Halobacillus andaensis]GGF20582.1 hydroxymethylpyrimidine/phosphomethylpyrimidine kinase [Halobacillus andaensis]
MSIPRALTIAGSAAQGSAGIQADLKTFQELDVYGMSAVTAIVANNSTTEQGIFTQPVQAIEAQIHASFEHVEPQALKTGMLFTEEIIDRTSELISYYGIKNVVVDPVMIGKMGSQLLLDEAIEALTKHLLPTATIITPNLEEAARLLNVSTPDSPSAMEKAARELHETGAQYVLVKGGSLKDYPAIDILYDGEEMIYLQSERFPTIHTSGAGCTYSAAITAELAKGKPVEEAVRTAKAFVTTAIKYALNFNRGIGSTYHAAYRKYHK